MNKIAKYLTGFFGIIIVTYAGWIVIKTTFPVDEWFRQNPNWRTFFILLVIIGVIGLLSALITPKGK